VSTAGRRELGIDDMGQEGPHLCAAHPARLEAGQVMETVCYFVLPDGVEAAAAYRTLSKLASLP